MKLVWPADSEYDDTEQYYPDEPWYNDAYIAVAEDGCLSYNDLPCIHGSCPVKYEK